MLSDAVLGDHFDDTAPTCLNAPSGAQCFPTRGTSPDLGLRKESLNAPSGAQCFPTRDGIDVVDRVPPGLNAPSGAQCFPTRGRPPNHTKPHRRSQCTFWCSVLSDSQKRLTRDCENLRVSMHLLVLSAFRLGAYSHTTANIQVSQCTFWCSVLSDCRKIFFA